MAGVTSAVWAMAEAYEATVPPGTTYTFDLLYSWVHRRAALDQYPIVRIVLWQFNNAICIQGIYASPNMVGDHATKHKFCRSMEEIQLVMFGLDNAVDYVRMALHARFRWDRSSDAWKRAERLFGFIGMTKHGKYAHLDHKFEMIVKIYRAVTGGKKELHVSDAEHAYIFGVLPELYALKTDTTAKPRTGSRTATTLISDEVAALCSLYNTTNLYGRGNPCTTDGEDINVGEFTALTGTALDPDFCNRANQVVNTLEGFATNRYTKDGPAPPPHPFAKKPGSAASAEAITKSRELAFSTLDVDVIENAVCTETKSKICTLEAIRVELLRFKSDHGHVDLSCSALEGLAAANILASSGKYRARVNKRAAATVLARLRVQHGCYAPPDVPPFVPPMGDVVGRLIRPLDAATDDAAKFTSPPRSTAGAAAASSAGDSEVRKTRRRATPLGAPPAGMLTPEVAFGSLHPAKRSKPDVKY